MKSIKSLASEIIKLLERRAELIGSDSPEVEAMTRQLIKDGVEPREAARQAQEKQVQAMADDIEVDAIHDRIEELAEVLAEALKAKRDKLQVQAESKARNGLLRWMSGTGAKLFADERCRERTFLFSDEAKEMLKAWQQWLAVPVLNVRESFRWFQQKAEVPADCRSTLGKYGDSRTTPDVFEGESGNGWEGLQRLCEIVG